MIIGTRVNAGIREHCDADPSIPDHAAKSAGRRDDSCKIFLFDAPICWLRTIHRHTASKAFHHPTNMSLMICQANSWRVPMDRKLGYAANGETTRAEITNGQISQDELMILAL